jgi:hypothetical protein
MAIPRRIPTSSGPNPIYEFAVGGYGGGSILNQGPDTGASGPFTPPPPPDPNEVPNAPPPPVVQPERGGETPRERAASGGGGGTGSPGLTGGLATPPRPRVPTPVAGAAGQPPQGPSVNSPLPPIVSQARQRSLMGGLGGLTMGGLGVPFDPTSNQKSDPISSLMELLKGRF